mmetsp:Transcript_27241/g.47014  ORF Transcript_27241/g.47014 Transcript_27241/m.47014 type:complete len:229 (+) Transcript_27241:150-836(+)
MWMLGLSVGLPSDSDPLKGLGGHDQVPPQGSKVFLSTLHNPLFYEPTLAGPVPTGNSNNRIEPSLLGPVLFEDSTNNSLNQSCCGACEETYIVKPLNLHVVCGRDTACGSSRPHYASRCSNNARWTASRVRHLAVRDICVVVMLCFLSMALPSRAATNPPPVRSEIHTLTRGATPPKPTYVEVLKAAIGSAFNETVPAPVSPNRRSAAGKSRSEQTPIWSKLNYDDES